MFVKALLRLPRPIDAKLFFFSPFPFLFYSIYLLPPSSVHLSLHLMLGEKRAGRLLSGYKVSAAALSICRCLI